MDREKPLGMAGRFESLHLSFPLADRFVGNLDPTFREEVSDATVAEAEAVLQPNGVTNDFRWKSMSMIVCFGVFHGFSLPNLSLT